jgi:hypothetical protein
MNREDEAKLMGLTVEQDSARREGVKKNLKRFLIDPSAEDVYARWPDLSKEAVDEIIAAATEAVASGVWDRLPTAAYIRRTEKRVQVSARVPRDVMEGARRRSKLLKTSMNRYVEAALRRYADDLDRDGPWAE